MMEKSWNLLSFYLGLLCCELCNGLPINLENAVADSHTQFLTGILAVLVTVCSVVFLAGCLCCQRGRGFKEFRDSPVVASAASNLDHGHINPVANGEFTIFTPLSPPHQNNNVFLANQQVITRTQEDYTFGDVDVSSWFNGTETEFPRIKLKYLREIGKGWFGRVVEGTAQDIVEEQKWTPVVVRILEATASSRERVVFLHDAAIYRCGVHPNILRIFGRCLDTVPLLLLQEYCPQGDLKKYLLENQATADKLLSTEYPLIWCCQITSALKHLHDNSLTHPDLATRNCQLTSNLTLKIGDYGLNVFQYSDDYYQGSPGVPLRWCAPESLSCTSTTIEPKKVTPEANIWSLGVTMWEICECGKRPYSDFSDDEVVAQVLGPQSLRLGRPKCPVLYTDYIFRLMELCWTSAESRPAVAQIDLMLADLLQVYKNTSSVQSESPVLAADFDQRWESFKPNSIVKTDNHINDSTEVDMDNVEIASFKPLSPSMNNLHGSLDNLLITREEPQMESWLENIASKTGDMSFVRGLSDAINELDNALALENSVSSDSSPPSKQTIEFQLGPMRSAQRLELSNQNDSLTDSMIFVQRTSSESETEEENWKKKIERGAYSEKVRRKSRSVTDLMILTHIDPSESESETPLPSLDYRINYKNVRLAPRHSLETASLMFGSEGNLLTVQDTFQEELRKLQEDRRDSLLFVPENCSQVGGRVSQLEDSTAAKPSSSCLDGSPSARILQELNGTSEIKPSNQVFNVFNVVIDKYNPVHLSATKLEEIINFRDTVKSEHVLDIVETGSIETSHSDLRLENDTALQLHATDVEDLSVKAEKESLQNNAHEDVLSIVQPFKDNFVNKELKKTVVVETEDLSTDNIKGDSSLMSETGDLNLKESLAEPNLDVSESLEYSEMPPIDETLDVAANQTTDVAANDNQTSKDELTINETVVVPEKMLSNQFELDQTVIIGNKKSDASVQDGIYADATIILATALNETIVVVPSTMNEIKIVNQQNESKISANEPISSEPIVVDIPTESHIPIQTFQVPKLVDLIQDNDSLMDFIISKYETEMSDRNSNYDSLEMTTSEDLAVEPPTVEAQTAEIDPNTKVAFDLSEEQDQAMPNSLTHSSVFTSTPFSRRSLQEMAPTLPQRDGFSSLNLFDAEKAPETQTNLYSLETWDNFLGKTLDSQDGGEEVGNDLFDSFTSEPQSLLFIESDDGGEDKDNGVENVKACDKTYEVCNDGNVTVDVSNNPNEVDKGAWETGGAGWFLHPQSNEDISGEMTAQAATKTDSYVGFNMDDEIMAAIRNELINKLPQAQGCSNGGITEDEEWESTDRNEVFLRYNVYNTPLSPIPEEYSLECSYESTPRQQQSDEDDDWFEHEDPETESHSVQTVESTPHPEPLHRHTPSQDSCCSNDTLFNLEELTCAGHDADSETPSKTTTDESPFNEADQCGKQTTSETLTHIDSDSNKQVEISSSGDTVGVEAGAEKDPLNDDSDTIKASADHVKETVSSFLDNERLHECVALDVPFVTMHVAPLPSPEDNPWKQLPASLLSYDKVISQNSLLPVPVSKACESQVGGANDMKESLYVNNVSDERDYESSEKSGDYETVTNIDDIYNEADYVNIVNLENTKNTAEFGRQSDADVGDDAHGENDFSGQNALIIDDDEGEHDVFDVLTDIRFSGPSDSHLMTTSFSESNELNDGPDWDSGSDTRSNSSGEFIWKLDDTKPMEEIQEESSSDSSTESDEEGESPEFVPSAWDKFATPSKSALRSPEKSLERSNSKTPRGVWFKKQKYHCVYEYPREPESPVLHSYDLWKPQPDYSSFAGESAMDDEFYVSSSAKPFDMISGLSSQFFPGNWSESKPENATPDSGVEDITPASLIDNNLIPQIRNAHSLKQLASEAVKKGKKDVRSSDVLGGLRHTRNKLKLDLPPSPSAFTSNKMFSIEPTLDPVAIREKPTFTTFGKSRFLVQHVDTPAEDDGRHSTNVSFEALPYKPLDKHVFKPNYNADNSKGNVEIVRGEASLLDSADEDSGIESSTLERKLNNVIQ